MRRVALDSTTPAVQEFLQALPPEPVELELGGQVVCTVIPPQADDADTSALIERGRQLVGRSRQRNKGVSAAELKQEVRQAVDEVRHRKGR
jgi:hypothetical protein